MVPQLVKFLGLEDNFNQMYLSAVLRSDPKEMAEVLDELRVSAVEIDD